MAKQPLLPFSAIRNADFLSNHWLDKRLTLEPEWTALRPAANAALAQLAQLWDREKNLLPKYGDEAGMEEAFIQPVLDALGWKLKYQTFLQGRKPDYALFLSPQDHANAIHAGRDNPDFWKYPKLVADAKAWDVSLDRTIDTSFRRELTPQQLEDDLDRSPVPHLNTYGD